MIEIKLQFSKPQRDIRSDYRRALHGFMSTLLGDNNYKESKSKYSYTGFQNCVYDKGLRKIVFNDNPIITVRIDDNDIDTYNNLCSNITSTKIDNYEIKVVGVAVYSVSDFSRREFSIRQDTPIRLGRGFEGIDEIMNEEEIKKAEEYLISQTLDMAKEYDIDISNGLRIKIIKDYRPMTIRYNKNISHKCRIMELDIECDDKLKEFILIHGLGRSHSCGFGFVY